MAQDSQSRDRMFSRRTILASGAAISISLAGCSGESPNGDGTVTEEQTTSTTTSQRPTTTTATLDQPVEVPEEATCAVCEMKPAEYDEENAQIAHEDGTREFFCSPGCMVAYYAVPGYYNDGYSKNTIVSIWVHDYSSKSLIDGFGANYVLELNGEKVQLPMNSNPVPFAHWTDAQAFTKDFDPLTTHDIVDIRAFDLSLARKYRSPQLPEANEKSILDPVSVPQDRECAVCNMKPVEYEDANSQLSFSDGEREFFCSPGCLTAFYAEPTHFGADNTNEDIVGVWDHDYETKELMKADLATYVLETEGDRVELPMQKNPVPFKTEEDAVEYVAQYEDLSEQDLVSLLEFDRELAEKYRGNLF